MLSASAWLELSQFLGVADVDSTLGYNYVPDVIVDHTRSVTKEQKKLTRTACKHRLSTEHARHRRRTAGQIARFMPFRLLRSVMELLGA